MMKKAPSTNETASPDSVTAATASVNGATQDADPRSGATPVVTNVLNEKLPGPGLAPVAALVVAMTGTGYAAITLPKSSVGTKQLKKNAVVSKKVKNGSLLKRDFKSGQLPQGPKGDKGDQGVQGVPGDPGSARAYALIGSNGSVNRAKNVTGVSHTAGGVYCFDLPFTPDNAVATGARPGPGSFSFKTFVTTGVAPDLGSASCVAPFTDAVAAVTESGDAVSFVDGAFFIMFN